MQKYNLPKKSSKRNQNPSKYYYNSILTNLKFQQKPKTSSFKNPLKETKILQDIIITLLELISSFNTSPKYHLFKNPHIKINRPIIIT